MTSKSKVLRDKIREYVISCQCGRARQMGHLPNCEWNLAVHAIYELERDDDERQETLSGSEADRVSGL